MRRPDQPAIVDPVFGIPGVMEAMQVVVALCEQQDFAALNAAVSGCLDLEKGRGRLPLAQQVEVLEATDALAELQRRLREIMARNMRRHGKVPPACAPPAHPVDAAAAPAVDDKLSCEICAGDRGSHVAGCPNALERGAGDP